MAQQDLENYFRGRQVSLQWLSFLRALSSEFSASASPDEISSFFFRVGAQYANSYAPTLQDVQSLEQLERSLNAIWSRTDWGWVTLTEIPGFVEIVHQAAPLAEAFGEESLVWSCSLLEGFYETVFSVLGAGERMRIHRDEISDGMVIRLRFGAS